jgi:hypothetical protein
MERDSGGNLKLTVRRRADTSWSGRSVKARALALVLAAAGVVGLRRRRVMALGRGGADSADRQVSRDRQPTGRGAVSVASRHRDQPASRPRLPSSGIEWFCAWVRPSPLNLARSSATMASVDPTAQGFSVAMPHPRVRRASRTRLAVLVLPLPQGPVRATTVLLEWVPTSRSVATTRSANGPRPSESSAIVAMGSSAHHGSTRHTLGTPIRPSRGGRMVAAGARR